MTKKLLFVVGTDTNVGKSVLTVALTHYLRQRGAAVAALKPFCSGGREDALALAEALQGSLPLDDINPWHYRAPIAPGIAATRRPDPPRWREVARFIRRTADQHEITLVEGAGGLLSPLTIDGDATDLISALEATPLVVGPNKLGAINQVLLVMQALPQSVVQRTRVVLMAQARPDVSAPTNLKYLRSRLGPDGVFQLPRLTAAERGGRLGRAAATVLNDLLAAVGVKLSAGRWTRRRGR
jgi:dethiobiotin synthetase